MLEGGGRARAEVDSQAAKISITRRRMENDVSSPEESLFEMVQSVSCCLVLIIFVDDDSA